MNASTPLTILALAGILAAASPASAQTASPQLPVAIVSTTTVTAATSYVSAYVYRGRELAGESVQPSIEADFNRTAVGIWASTPVANPNSQRFSEIDPYATYTAPLGGNFSLIPGGEVYTYTADSAAVGGFPARVEPNLSLSYDARGVKLTPTAYYDLTLRQLTLEFTASAALPLASIGSEVDLTAVAGNYSAENALHGSPQREKMWGSYWLLGATVPYQLGRHFRVSAGYAYTDGVDAHTQLGDLPAKGNPQAAARGVFTVSVTRTF